VILGIVQGLTEFLPISSTAHLRIVPALFGWHFDYATAHTNDPGAAFTAIIQLGTMIAIVVYFWRELMHVVSAWFRGIIDRDVRGSLEYRFGWYLILATIPVCIFGVIFSDQIETGARNLWLIAGTLIVLALVMLVAERVSSRARGEEEINTKDAITIGLAQAVALVPGASRSGTTITAGLFRGLTREAAARFSFLLSVPAVVLSGIYEAARINSKTDPGPGVGLTGVAVVISFIVGLASIHWLMRWLGKHSTYVFIVYRVLLGLLLFGLLAGGVIDATN
jgi:undecaprenyl-diphosphatase